MHTTRNLAMITLVMMMLSGFAAGQDLLMVDVYKDSGQVMITGTSTTEGYPPRNPTDSGDYLVRVADSENKTLQSRYFDLENTTEGHAPPTDDRATVTHTIVFPYHNQTSHVVLYDENMQRVERHQVQNEPPSTGPGEQSPQDEGHPLWIYLGAGVGALVIAVILYLSIDFG